jgi:hypothetical protein
LTSGVCAESHKRKLHDYRLGICHFIQSVGFFSERFCIVGGRVLTVAADAIPELAAMAAAIITAGQAGPIMAWILLAPPASRPAGQAKTTGGGPRGRRRGLVKLP